MIFISNVIADLEKLKLEHGDLPVLTACQIMPHTVDFKYTIESFYNGDKTVELKVIVVKGYKE